MFNPPNLFQGRQLAERRSLFTSKFGFPDSWTDAERTLNEMRPQSNPQSAIQNPQSPTPGRLIQPSPLSPAPMKRVNPMDGSARFIGMAPTPYGQVPAGIAAANPGAYFDPVSGSTVIGDPNHVNQRNVGGPTWSGGAVQDGTAFFNNNNAEFGMAKPGQRRSTIGGRGTPAAPDMFGHQFDKPTGPAPMGTTQSGGQSHAPKPYMPGLLGLAEGGEVNGPGGPKDDLVPAMLSDGEFIIPADAVRRIGTDRLEKMIEPPDMEKKKPKAPPSMHGGMMHMAAGGFVNPYADDPMAAALREQQAKDARLAAIGGADMGGGRAAFVNRYGSGYAVRPADSMASTGPGQFNNGGDAMTATPGAGLQPVPDIIPSGPWSNGAMPFDTPGNRSNIAVGINQMAREAADRRALDLAANASRLQFTPKGRGIITVPDANPFPYGDHGGTERTGFMAPWEKDAQAASQRNAPIQPFLDAGMKKSDIRQMMRTPQGMQTLQDMQPDQWTPIPGTDYMQGRKGQTVPMRRTGDQVAVPAGLEPESMTVGGVRYAKPKAAAAPKPPKIVGTTEDESKLKFNMHADGTRSIVGSPTPSAEQKLAAFKYMTGREINPNSPEDWSQAYYFATGRQPPETAAATTAAPAREFKTPEEAMAAKLKPGDRVMIGGRMATWRE